jgi:cytidine deaminase
MDERDRVVLLEGVLRDLCDEVEREVRECSSLYPSGQPCGTCREVLKPWAERAHVVLRDA